MPSYTTYRTPVPRALQCRMSRLFGCWAKKISSTVRYIGVSPDRFKNFGRRPPKSVAELHLLFPLIGGKPAGFRFRLRSLTVTKAAQALSSGIRPTEQTIWLSSRANFRIFSAREQARALRLAAAEAISIAGGMLMFWFFCPALH